MAIAASAIRGLNTSEAEQRLQQYGPNAIPEERPHLIRWFLRKFWGPVPWMLEVSVILELVLGKNLDALITAILLLVNAVLSFVQETRAQQALALLRQGLTVNARVLRDGRWQILPSGVLVPGDVVRLRVGDIVPADLRVIEGQIAADQSALTGESLPVDLGESGTAYAGSVVRRGEATGEITATGPHTFYGKTAELVHTAKTVSHLETVILRVVNYLVAMDVTLVIAILIYALVNGLPLADVLPFSLILLIASVPVALPATFTLATALGSLDLSRRGVIVSRLSAVEEAAAMDVLCSDKTGTITQNQLVWAADCVYPPYSEDDLIRLAALASDEASQDPIDQAVLAQAQTRQIQTTGVELLQFIPFDPLTKRTEALVNGDGETRRITKGIPAIVAGMTAAPADLVADVDELARQGYRVLAVAEGPSSSPLQLVGLIALQDPPRADSKATVEQLRDLGVQVLMITGDGLTTARAIAAQVGITGAACAAEVLRQNGHSRADCEVFAGVYPEDKFHLVRTLQAAGHVVGMTGDGVNDAPALKQAEVGVAVANATDVAKAAASIVLTKPGLSSMLSAVEIGRQTYQRMLTYTFNKIIKTFQVALFLSLGLLLMGIFVTRPRLILLLLFANDFVTMSLATDRVTASRSPDRWNIRPLVIGSLVLAAAWLVFSFGILLIGRNVFHLAGDPLQTLLFVMLVFTGQANVYLVRERRHLWASLPSRWMLVSTVVDVAIVSFLAAQGILMAAIDPALIAGLLVLVLIYLVGLDFLKLRLFTYLKLR